MSKRMRHTVKSFSLRNKADNAQLHADMGCKPSCNECGGAATLLLGRDLTAIDPLVTDPASENVFLVAGGGGGGGYDGLHKGADQNHRAGWNSVGKDCDNAHSSYGPTYEQWPHGAGGKGFVNQTARGGARGGDFGGGGGGDNQDYCRSPGGGGGGSWAYPTGNNVGLTIYCDVDGGAPDVNGECGKRENKGGAVVLNMSLE